MKSYYSIPSATKELINKILDALQNSKVTIKIVPVFMRLLKAELYITRLEISSHLTFWDAKRLALI